LTEMNLEHPTMNLERRMGGCRGIRRLRCSGFDVGCSAFSTLKS
jgi:hypothetical protein